MYHYTIKYDDSAKEFDYLIEKKNTNIITSFNSLLKIILQIRTHKYNTFFFFKLN